MNPCSLNFQSDTPKLQLCPILWSDTWATGPWAIGHLESPLSDPSFWYPGKNRVPLTVLHNSLSVWQSTLVNAAKNTGTRACNFPNPSWIFSPLHFSPSLSWNFASRGFLCHWNLSSCCNYLGRMENQQPWKLKLLFSFRNATILISLFNLVTLLLLLNRFLGASNRRIPQDQPDPGMPNSPSLFGF